MTVFIFRSYFTNVLSNVLTPLVPVYIVMYIKFKDIIRWLYLTLSTPPDLRNNVYVKKIVKILKKINRLIWISN